MLELATVVPHSGVVKGRSHRVMPPPQLWRGANFKILFSV